MRSVMTTWFCSRLFGVANLTTTWNLIEIHGLDLEQSSSHEIVIYLRESGYKLVAYNMTNALFRECA
jgi:hypothetical protein